MPHQEFIALMFALEFVSVFVVASVLKRWMHPPAKYWGRWTRALLACLTSLPVSGLAVFAAAVAISGDGSLYYSSGGLAGQFMVNIIFRGLVIWPFVIAWLVIKPPRAQPSVMPPPLP